MTLKFIVFLQGTIAKLKLKSSELLSEAQQNLESTRASLHEKIEDLRAKVAEKDVKINKYLRELQVLRHYKENDFPVRMVRIEQMKEQLDGEQISHKGDLEELNQDIVKEKEHHHQKVEADKMQMNAMVIKVSIFIIYNNIWYMNLDKFVCFKCFKKIYISPSCWMYNYFFYLYML